MEEFEALVQGAVSKFREEIRAANGGGITDSVKAFYHAVDWTARPAHAVAARSDTERTALEPLLVGILAFHAALVVAAAATAGRDAAQAALFLLSLLAIRLSERLNAYGAANWRELSTQNYFDKNGVFLGVVWCGPLLVLAMGILVGFLVRMARLLVSVKRMEIRGRVRAARREAGEQEGAGDGAVGGATGATGDAAAGAGGAGGGGGARKRRG